MKMVVLEVSIEMLVMVNEDNVTRWIDYVVYDKIFFERIGLLVVIFAAVLGMNLVAIAISILVQKKVVILVMFFRRSNCIHKSKHKSVSRYSWWIMLESLG
ncbi:uncharacterized protein LOC122046079 isoform X2 [Zingiber officinale]|uniref:uncharacterized protein LOC122046079 isoform X2 n=1 Tax=Zingiber officinale TaxID=94328 RepID=UPI001C4CBC87|nr:uncharacterized protein LOC122046079 isoform X2 [Zingiber officinale]